MGGVRGVILEALQVGGRRCTSVEALQRFFKALSQKSEATHLSAQAETSGSRGWIDEELDRKGL